METRLRWWGLAIALLLGSVFLTSGVLVTAAEKQEVVLFVTSEATNTVGVYRGSGADLTKVATIPVGTGPHNLALSGSGKWVAVDNRRSDEVSMIDTTTLQEVIRLKTGRQPHDMVFSPDSSILYIGHEIDPYIARFEVGSWKALDRLQVGTAQHDISVTQDHTELWFTVTGARFKPGLKRVGVVDLRSGKLAQMIDTGDDAHDVIFSPDGKEAWVTNSGFLTIPSDVVNVIDVGRREVLTTLKIGKYPFHAPKRGRDGNYVPSNAREMWFSDHGLKQLLVVDLTSRQVVASVKVGAEPFHVTMTPDGVIYVANHHSGTVSVIDGPNRKPMGTIKVDKHPHGIAVLVPAAHR
jgi:YVTN family beta-propeller protein